MGSVMTTQMNGIKLMLIYDRPLYARADFIMLSYNLSRGANHFDKTWLETGAPY